MASSPRKVGSQSLTAEDARLVAGRLPLDQYGDEELVKLTRQLEFAVSKNGGGIDSFLENIVSSQSNDMNRIKVPKRRFGKTNLQVSIVTCGGMRFQETWCPDTLFPLGSRSPVVGFGMSAIKTSCQNNLIATIRRALAIGVNHFETARSYGTSEMQLADALHAMITSGEIKREDFVLQTKLLPTAKFSDFITLWESSWSLFGKLGYIDLLSSHGLSSEKEYKWVFENGEDSNLPFMQKLVKEGKVKHLGFATHGTPALVAKTINQGVFSYVNLHCHGVFGSYHGSGISDGAGDYGHRANVALAKRLDMGIFIISPVTILFVNPWILLLLLLLLLLLIMQSITTLFSNPIHTSSLIILMIILFKFTMLPMLCITCITSCSSIRVESSTNLQPSCQVFWVPR